RFGLRDLRLHAAAHVRARDPVAPRLVRHAHPRRVGGVFDSADISSGVAVSAMETSRIWRGGGSGRVLALSTPMSDERKTLIARGSMGAGRAIARKGWT